MKKSNGIKILIAILVILIIAVGILLGMKLLGNKEISGKIQTGDENTQNTQPQVIEVKEPETFKGTDRPIAVMIDNHIGAVPQAGLNDAYIVYEIIVEGGETRLMALFKGVELDQIGPVRSARHYFLDYALENDAIYVHFGHSPQAEADIKNLDVEDIEGIQRYSSEFWRTSDKYAPHNVATSTEDILNISESYGYETTSTQKSVLKYVAEPVDLKSNIEATDVIIPYSTSNTVEYEYDPVTKRYTRYTRDVKQTDWITEETVTTKNIIIVRCENTTLDDGENKGRQTLDNIGTLDGYYITEGKAIEIRAEKESRESQTVYKDLNGKEIEVNDGNTFIQICPIDADVEILPGAPEPVVEQTTNQVNSNVAM